MSSLIVLLSLCVSVVLLSSHGFSTPAHQVLRDVQAQTPCGLESKDQYYQAFLANSADRSAQVKAIEAAKKYLACPGGPEDLAKLNLAVGLMLGKNSAHEEAIPYFIKAASYDSKIRVLPETYFYLGEAYEKGSYARLAAKYKAQFEGRDETDASLLALENIYQIVDCIIDAYARAVVLAGDQWRQLKPRPPGLTVQASDGSFSQIECLEAATSWYRVRHQGSTAGLNEMILTIVSQPLPPQPTPLTSLPPPEKRY